jgi:hypothetical protein
MSSTRWHDVELGAGFRAKAAITLLKEIAGSAALDGSAQARSAEFWANRNGEVMEQLCHRGLSSLPDGCYPIAF